MKTQEFQLTRYDADEGKVFDWKEPRYLQVPVNPYNPEEGTKNGEQEHLYVKTLFIGGNDTIENYVEVKVQREEQHKRINELEASLEGE